MAQLIFTGLRIASENLLNRYDVQSITKDAGDCKKTKWYENTSDGREKSTLYQTALFFKINKNDSIELQKGWRNEDNEYSYQRYCKSGRIFF